MQQQLSLPKLQRKIEEVTADLPNQETVNKLTELPAANSLTVCSYLIAMKKEVNSSKKYRQTNIQTLCYLSRHHKHQLRYEDMTRDDVIMYLNSLMKPDSIESST